MDPREELTELVADIISWISQSPPREEIFDYFKALPEDQYETLLYSAYLSLDTAYEKLNAGWLQYGINIPDVLTVIDEIECTTALAQYNSRSVFTKYQKRFPALIIPSLIPDLHEWVRGFFNIWRASNEILIMPTYTRRLVDIKVLASRMVEPEGLNLIDQVMTTLYEQDRKAVSASVEQQGVEREQQANLLESLKLFPDEYIETLLDPVHYAQKAELIASYMTGIALLRNLSVSPGELRDEGIERVLWDYLYALQQKDSLVYLQIHYQKISPVQKTVLDWLSVNFTITSLQNGSFVTQADAFFQTLGIANRPAVLQEFQAFLSFSPLAETITEPIVPRDFLDHLNRNRAIVEVTDLISGAISDIPDESRQQLAKLLFMAYLKLTHT